MKTVPQYSAQRMTELKEQASLFWESLATINSKPAGLPSQVIANLTVRFLGMTHDFTLQDVYGMPNLYLFSKGKGILAYRTELAPVEISPLFAQGIKSGTELDMDFTIKGHQLYKGTTLTFVTNCAFYPASERPQIFTYGGQLRSRTDFHGLPPLLAGVSKDGELRNHPNQFLQEEAQTVKPVVAEKKSRVVHAEQLRLF